jgi:hypothetical protein
VFYFGKALAFNIKVFMDREKKADRHTFVSTKAESDLIIKAAHANLLDKSKYIRNIVLERAKQDIAIN